MNKLLTAAAMSAAVLLAAGCTTTDNTRNLADPTVPGNVLAVQVCSACHGTGGNSTNPTFPRLAAQNPTYLTEQLKAFRAHGRSDPPGFEYMWGISRSLTDKQIDELAAYFAAQTAVPDAPTNATLEAQGNDIFHNGVAATGVPACQTCHGEKGAGQAIFPRIASQHADYIIKQLTVIKETNQRPQAAMMKPIAHGLNTDQMKAVAAYLSTQP